MLKLMKYEFRKSASSKLILLVLTAVFELAFLGGVFFKGYNLPVVKTRIFANSLKNMVPIVTNSQTGSLIKNRTRN